MPPDINRNVSEPRLEHVLWLPPPIEDSEEEGENQPQPAQNASRNRNQNRNRNRNQNPNENQNPNRAQNNGQRPPAFPVIPALLRAFVAPQLRRFLNNRRVERRRNAAERALQSIGNQPSTSAAGASSSRAAPSTSDAGPSTSQTGASTSSTRPSDSDNRPPRFGRSRSAPRRN